MSEYWKSQPRKFCEFCKCWITDNKPSVQFHEKGKKHQENVKLRIEEVKKKGTADARKRAEENDYMQQMEKAALEAFKKDLADNPELAKKYNVKVKEPEEVYEGPSLPPGGILPPPSPEEKEEVKTDNGDWYEAMSDMGYPYYWNTLTGESIWVAPEKYVSLVDQGLAPPPVADTGQAAQKQQANSETKTEDIPLPPGVENIPLPGQNSPPSPPSPSESESEDEVTQDRSSRGVYGTWERIREEQQEQIDLELPKTEEKVETICIPIPTEPKVKFKEKRIGSLGPTKGGNVTFKKRKLASGARNVRKRDDEDD